MNQSVMTMGQAENGAGQNAMMAEEPLRYVVSSSQVGEPLPIVTLILAVLLLVQRSFMKARRTWLNFMVHSCGSNTILISFAGHSSDGNIVKRLEMT